VTSHVARFLERFRETISIPTIDDLENKRKRKKKKRKKESPPGMAASSKILS